MNIKLQNLTFDVIQQLFADVLAQKYGQLNFPNASDSTTTVRNERDLENWKTGIMNGYGNIELELNPEAANSREQIKVLDPKFLANKNRYIDAKSSYLDSERSAGRTSGLDEETINEEMTPGDYIKFLMDKFYEYRMLAADLTINDQATKLYLDKASEYYARAQEEIDKIEPDNTDHLSDEDKALPNVPLDEKDEELSDKDKAMIDKYEDDEKEQEDSEMNKIDAKMYRESVDLNRWAKLAGINEDVEDTNWEGYIDSLIKDDKPKGFAEMHKIILAKYPNVGRNDYGMFVDYDENGSVKYADGNFADEGSGSINFKFQFEDGKIVDYSFENK